MSAATPFPLGVFTTTPNPGSAAANAAFRADYAGFVATMGAAPSFLDTYIDNRTPISQWVSSAAWDAWALQNTMYASSMTPVIGLPLVSVAPGSASNDQTFQAWAAGTYDPVLYGMVQAWAKAGFSTQVWRPGWEMNLSCNAWYAGADAQTQSDFIAAFQHIYTVLHAAAQQYGVGMTVMWNPSAETNGGVNAVQSLYPGDAYVDAVAADVYADTYPYSLTDYGAHAGTSDPTLATWLTDPANRLAYWDHPAENPGSQDASNGASLSLAQLLSFTEAHGKPFAIGETGAGNSSGGQDVGDDAAFPSWLYGQLKAAQAAGTTIEFVNIWDSNDAGNYQFSQASDNKPQEAAAWASNFGATNPVGLANLNTGIGTTPGGTVADAPSSPAQALAVSNAAELFDSGRSDILLHGGGGSVAYVQINGTAKFSSGVIATPGASWHPVSTGDFDGDGISDVLLQNDDGSLAIWRMNGPGVAASATTASPGAGWHAIATGDFSGVGRSAVLLQNDNGAIATMQANGTSLSALTPVANPGLDWHAVATGDFTGGGKSGIVLQDDDGRVAVWEMNGSSIGAGAVVANPGPTWRVVGTGDFAGTGTSDILLQNDNGTVDIWTMNGTTVTSGAVVADPGPNWHVVDVGDFNGDGKADILFQADDGTVVDWLMNGSTVTASGVVYDPGYNWSMLGQGGMNFIDGTTTKGTLNATVLSDDFIFSTPAAGAHAIAGFDPLHDVVSLDQTRFGSYAAVQSHETQVGGSTMLDLGNGSTLTLNGVLPSQLAAHNFI